MRILVCGAAGFIGKHCVSQLLRDGFDVIGLSRNVTLASAQFPGLTWRQGDFSRLRSLEDWRPILQGIDGIVNCVGLLQAGYGDSLQDAHVEGPRSLYAACEQLGIKRIVHISAMGIGDNLTVYDRTKLAGEHILTRTPLDWMILRPGLVIAPDSYGGTALMRAFAALPAIVLVPDGKFTFLTVGIEDLTKIISESLRTKQTRRVIEVGASDPLSLTDIVLGLRRWMGLKPGYVVRVPQVLVRIALTFGDFAGWLGWPSGFRTASLQQIEKGVTAPVPTDNVIDGVILKSYTETLARYIYTDATLLDARIYVLRPIVLLSLALFWIISGAVAIGPAWDASLANWDNVGVDMVLAALLTWVTGLLDIVIGAAILVRPWSRAALIGSLALSVCYLIGASYFDPQLWFDPLGSLIKVFPAMVLTLVAISLSGRR